MPSKTKWTPGPWEYRFRDDKHYVGCGVFCIINAAYGTKETHKGNKGSEEQKANANLIAAAPELYEACEQALGAFEHAWAINWDDLRRALAKARGESPDGPPETL